MTMDHLHSACCTLWQSIAKVHGSFVQQQLASSATRHSTAQRSAAQHAFKLQCCSPILQLSDGALGVRADVVSQHHEAQQLHVGHMGLHLLLSHAQQVQLMHVWDDAHCHGHQPEAVAAEPILDLHHNHNNNNNDNNNDDGDDNDGSNTTNDDDDAFQLMKSWAPAGASFVSSKRSVLSIVTRYIA